MDGEDAKTAILERLCYDYNDMDEGLAWQPSKFNRNSRFLVEWFGDALDDLLAKDMFVERVPFETTHVRLTEAGTLRCK